MQITAAIAYAGKQDFELETVEIADPQPDEILVKIAGVGICHTDLIVRDAAGAIFDYPAVLGHEGAGSVVAIGENVRKVAVGDKVVVTFRSCGQCSNCSNGPAAYCEKFPELNMSGMRTDGSRPLSGKHGGLEGNFFGQSSFASRCLTYESNVVKIPKGVPAEIAGPLGCAVQTGAGAVLNSLDAYAGSSIAILGGGPVGQSAIMAAKLRGCETVILVEPKGERRDFAMSHGATHVVDPGNEKDLEAALRSIAPAGLDFAVDTTGLENVLTPAIAALKINGAIGLIGLSQPDADLPIKINRFSAAGIRIIGIIEGDSNPDEFLPFLMEQYLAGSLPFDDMIKTYPFAEINKAIAEQQEGKCIKAVLLPE